MTELLQQAIAKIPELPPDQQDAIAARFLAELRDEEKWETRFAATTDEQGETMAAMVRQEIAEVDIPHAVYDVDSSRITAVNLWLNEST